MTAYGRCLIFQSKQFRQSQTAATGSALIETPLQGSKIVGKPTLRLAGGFA
jgi:hypothetical protein